MSKGNESMNNRAVHLYRVLGAIVALGGCTSSPAQPTTATTTTPVVAATPITFSAPTTIAPLAGSASIRWPTLTMANVTRTGAVGTAQPPAGTYSHTSLTGIRWSVQRVGVSFLRLAIVGLSIKVLQLRLTGGV